MAAQRCPRCGLVNPSSAQRCDCGRSFVDGTLGAPLERLSPEERIAKRRARTLRVVARIVGGVMVSAAMGGMRNADHLSLVVLGVLAPIGVIGLTLVVASLIVKRS